MDFRGEVTQVMVAKVGFHFASGVSASYLVIEIPLSSPRAISPVASRCALCHLSNNSASLMSVPTPKLKSAPPKLRLQPSVRFRNDRAFSKDRSCSSKLRLQVLSAVTSTQILVPF